MSRFASLLCCLILIGLTPASAHAGTEENASKYIESLASQTLDIIQKDGARDSKKKKLEDLFAQSVDIKWVGRFVMGRFWRKATDEQQKRYLAAYESFVLNHYATRFTEYTSGEFEITGSRDEGNDEYTVNMALKNSGNAGDPPVLVDYRVRKNGKSFQVFDVIIEGVSMITTQRSEFASVISRGSIDHLITQLENKSLPVPST